MTDHVRDLNAAAAAVRKFNRRRKSWSEFHTPPKLAMALASEVGEVLSILRWADGVDDLAPDQRDELRLEIADVAIFLFALVDSLDLDLALSIGDKLKINEVRFPEEASQI